MIFKNKTLWLVCILFPTTCFVCGQSVNNIWTVKNPFEQKVFIENKGGQFKARNSNDSAKIYFAAYLSGVDVYFSSTGLTYYYDEYPKLSEDEKEKLEKETDTNELPKIKTHSFSVKWENANTDCQIIPSDSVSFYYTYSSGKSNIISRAYKKILYKNLYNGIDVEYSFPQDRSGMEYSIIVHPR